MNSGLAPAPVAPIPAEPLRPRVDAGLLALTTAVLLAVFAVTNRWESWARGIRAVHAGDVDNYEVIARAAPGFPSGRMGTAYTRRWPVHWLVGSVSDALHLSIPTVYWACFALLMIGIVTVLAVTLRALGLDYFACVLGLSAFVLNPWAFRFYAIAPGYLSDLVFVFGLAVVVYALVRCRGGVLVLGIVVASLARQTAVPLGFAVALWVLVVPSWRAHPKRRRVALAATVAVVPAFTYWLFGVVTAGWSRPLDPSFPGDSILPLFGSPVAHAREIVVHIGQVAAPLVVVLAMILAAGFELFRRGVRLRGVDPRVWCCLALSASIVVQPLVVSAKFPGFRGNEPRLAVLGLLPLVVALGLLLRALGGSAATARSDLRSLVVPWSSWALLGTVFLASLDIRYSILRPATKVPYFAVEALAPVLVAIFLSHRLRRAAHPAARDREPAAEPVSTPGAGESPA